MTTPQEPMDDKNWQLKEGDPFAPQSNLSTWPERIWLQHGDFHEVPSYTECHDVSWCWHAIDDADIEYVRSDLLEAQSAELARLRAENAALREQVKQAERNAAIWKQMAETYYGQRQYPDNLDLAHGALDAYAAGLGVRPALTRQSGAAAPVDRNAVLEEAARVVDEGQETFTCGPSTDGESVRHLTKRSRGNMAGIAYASAIRALKDSAPSRSDGADDQNRIAAVLPNGALVTNVYDAYAEGVKSADTALQTIIDFPITDPSNQDAANMKLIAVNAMSTTPAPAPANKDTARLDWIAINGATVRRANNGHKNLIVWGVQYPTDSDVEQNLREAIDAAIAAEQKGGA